MRPRRRRLARPGLAPHAIYSLSERSLRWVAERATSSSVPVQIHLSETEEEVERLRSPSTACGPRSTSTGGVLGPSARCSPTASGSTTVELDLIAERGATVVTNPVANLKLAVGGVFPYSAGSRARASSSASERTARARTTRSTCSRTAKAFALLQKDAAARSRGGHATETLEIATGRRSPLLERPGARGRGAGRLPARRAPTTPSSRSATLDAGLVYAASGSIVDTTVVAGRVLMRGGVVPDQAEVVGRARERAARLGLTAAAA